MGKHKSEARKRYIKQRSQRKKKKLEKESTEISSQPSSAEPDRPKSKEEDMEEKFQNDPLYKGFLKYNQYKRKLSWLEKKATFY